MTLILRIENEMFTEVVEGNERFDSFSEDRLRAVGNGWIVTLYPPANRMLGKINCRCGCNTVDGQKIYEHNFLLQDGDVGLSGGENGKKYAYFRTKRFAAFLDEHNIKSVCKKDPNRTYRSHKSSSVAGLMTDGSVQADRDEQGFEHRTVTNATWVLVDRERYDPNSGRDRARFLYTLEKNVRNLKIPTLSNSTPT